MKCPECVKAGLKSTVYAPDYWTTTDMLPVQYYDEDGVYHNHNMNSSTGRYRCSVGHAWMVTKGHRCPAPNCKFNGEGLT